MKHTFTYEDYDGIHEVHVESNAEVITDLIDHFAGYLLACGFLEETVNEALGRGDEWMRPAVDMDWLRKELSDLADGWREKGDSTQDALHYLLADELKEWADRELGEFPSDTPKPEPTRPDYWMHSSQPKRQLQ